MKVLVVNVGSTSIKFDIYDTEIKTSPFYGEVKNILTSPILFLEYGLKKIEKQLAIKSHLEAIPYINAYISSLGLQYDAIGFRVVHGGDFANHLLLDDNVLHQLKEYNALAPIHNPIIIEVINGYRRATNKPICLVFDTVYYHGLSDMHKILPVPKEWFNLGVKKYGFHGLNHQYLYEKVTEFGPFKKVVTCHLGAGSSITASFDGKVVDTSMSLSPMSGLMMATRSGDIDPMIFEYIANKTSLTIPQISNALTMEAGWYGLSGILDMKELEVSALAGNADSILAVNVYVKKVLEFISSYYIFLGGIDALVFSGGIGENSSIIRTMILKGLAPLGFKIDEAANSSAEVYKKINNGGTPVYVIKSNEASIIAKYTEQIVKGLNNESN